MIRRPPRSTPFPTRRSSDLAWRRLLVPGIVIGVARRGELVVNARPLIEKSTIAAPCDGVEAWERERPVGGRPHRFRSEEHTSELQSQSNLVCRLLLEKKKHT